MRPGICRGYHIGSLQELPHTVSNIGVAFQNGLRLTVDFSRKRWLNSRLRFQKLTQQSTMVSKVDQTVDSWKKRPTTFNCRGFKKKSRLLQLVDCRFFVDFASSISVRKWQNSYKKASTSSTISVKVNSRLRGGSEIGQQLTFSEKLDGTVDYGFKSWPNCWLWFQKLTELSTLVSKVDRTVNYGFKSWPDCRLPRFSSNDCRLLQKKSGNSRFMIKSRLST